MKRILLSLLAVASTFFACETASKKNPSAAFPEFKGRWELYYMPGYSMPFEVMYADTKPYIDIDNSNGRYSGLMICNTLSGSVEITDSIRIRFSQPLATSLKCDGPLPAEPTFLNALQSVEFYQWHHPDTLWLLKQNLLVMKLIRKR